MCPEGVDIVEGEVVVIRYLDLVRRVNCLCEQVKNVGVFLKERRMHFHSCPD